MFHPLLGSMSKMKDSEIEEKILELSKKYGIAMRMGQGGIGQQIIVALESYKAELSNRQRAALSSAMTKQNKDLDNLINVD
jgi:hypothetical protein